MEFVSQPSAAEFQGSTLAEVIVGLAVFGLLTLAVVGTIIQTARLDTKDTGLTETTFLADSLLEQRVSDAREYEKFRDLTATPSGQFWALEPERADGLQERYIYRVEVESPSPALKKVVVAVYHRDKDFPVPTPDTHKGQNGMAITVGTLIGEPGR
jgi:hypothetical protein